MTMPYPPVENKDSQKPISGSTVIWIFVGLAFVGSLIDAVACLESVEWVIPHRALIIQLYIIFLTLGWVSFTISITGKELFSNLVLLSICCGLLIAMVLVPSPVLFWAGLFFIIAFGVVDVLHRMESEGLWQKILACIFTTWVIAGFVITFGNTKYLIYSRPAFAIAEVHLLMDLRYLMTMLMVTVFLGKSVAEAAKDDRPKISPIRPFPIPNEPAKWGPKCDLLPN
jgi:hypothetical protein